MVVIVVLVALVPEINAAHFHSLKPIALKKFCSTRLLTFMCPKTKEIYD